MVVSWGGYFEPKDLLQLDGTIIAGILILMTISAYYQKKYTLKFWGHPREIITLSLIVFCTSALIILGTEIPNSNETDGFARFFSIYLAGTGLVILVGGVVILLKAVSDDEKTKSKKKQNDDDNQ
jgi:hypothetical protein